MSYYYKRKPYERYPRYNFYCLVCNKNFMATRPDAQYCSPTCRKRASRARKNHVIHSTAVDSVTSTTKENLRNLRNL